MWYLDLRIDSMNDILYTLLSINPFYTQTNINQSYSSPSSYVEYNTKDTKVFAIANPANPE